MCKYKLKMIPFTICSGLILSIVSTGIILSSSTKYTTLNKSTQCLSELGVSQRNSVLLMSDDISDIDVNSINNFDIKSPTKHLIYINISEQKAYVFKGSNRNWSLEKEFLCSTGLPGTETPTGIFNCNYRGDWFYSEKYKMGAKYYIHINDCYYLHSVPLYSDGTTIAENTLGKPASHGCVRLSVEDAQWIYNNTQDGSTIIIY